MLFEVTLCDARYWDNALDRPPYHQARRPRSPRKA